MTVVTIGYRQYAVRKAADAAAIIRLMAEAMPVESTYRNNRIWFWPSRENDRNKISMEVVPDTQFLPAEPPAGQDIQEPVATPRRRGLRLIGPSIKTPSTKEAA